MEQRFYKGKNYTLALAGTDSFGETFTFCVNVTYRGRIGVLLSFSSFDGDWTVDMTDREATLCEETPIYDSDITGLDDYRAENIIGYNCDFRTYYLCNIVRGWQF